MVKLCFLFIFIVTLHQISSQTIDYITSTPVIVQDSIFDSNWEHLLPTLKIIKSTSNIKKERLLNVVKVIKFLLSDEIQKNECDKILEEIKETNVFQTAALPEINSIVNERLNVIKIGYDNDYREPRDVVLQKNIPQNKTADFSKILAKISAALTKIQDQKEKEEMKNTPALMGMFRSGNNVCKDNFDPRLFETLGQFTIPCQRASDILKETPSFLVPKGAYCDLPKNINMNSFVNDPKLHSDNLPFKEP